MLKFKEYLQKEELTVGRHNDGASNFNGRTGYIANTEFTGSEGFEKPRGQQAHLAGQDLVMQDLPKETINGKILSMDIKKDPCDIKIWTEKGMIIQKIPYDHLKSFVTGYTTPEDAKGKNISLVCQGHVKGMSHVRSGTIS
jgi:hypothetical protein